MYGIYMFQGHVGGGNKYSKTLSVEYRLSSINQDLDIQEGSLRMIKNA